MCCSRHLNCDALLEDTGMDSKEWLFHRFPLSAGKKKKKETHIHTHIHTDLC